MSTRDVGLIAIMLIQIACAEHRPQFRPDASDLTDAGIEPADASVPYPAPHPAPPQVATAGGPVLQSARFVPVFFSNDDAATLSTITTFLSQIGSSDYWTATTHEYGVGPASATVAVQIDEPMSGVLSQSDVEAWLTTTLQAGGSVLPPPDESTLYVIHFPASVGLTEGKLPSCDPGGFGGYHSNIVLADGTRVAYAVMPRCDNFYDLSGTDEITGAESQVLVSAALDPFPATSPAYNSIDDDHLYWIVYDEAESPIVLDEPPDICARVVGAFLQPAGFPYTVLRSWSNAAANAGQDPCVPAPAGEIYFAAVPELDDELPTSTVGGTTGTMLGVNIPQGESKTITVDLFSDAPIGLWQVEANDFAYLLGAAPRLAFSLDQSEGSNGDKLHLTITPTAPSANHVELFVITAHLGPEVNSWVGVVGD